MSQKTIRVKIKAKNKGVHLDSMEATWRLLTNERMELIRIVRDHSPKSVDELACLAERDFNLVHQDVNLLRKFGFIDAAESKQELPTQLKTKTTEILVRIAV